MANVSKGTPDITMADVACALEQDPTSYQQCETDAKGSPKIKDLPPSMQAQIAAIVEQMGQVPGGDTVQKHSAPLSPAKPPSSINGHRVGS